MYTNFFDTLMIRYNKIIRVVKRREVRWALKIKTEKTINTLINTSKFLIHKEHPIIVYWWTGAGGNNWGDALNPILIQNLSGKKPVSSKEIINFKNQNVYSIIGSVLGFFPERNLVIWGSGFISYSSRFKQIPRKICAVRGPLTRKLIIDQGIDCPEIYGDPALLYPLFYNPNIRKIYKLGIIPHYSDQDSYLMSIFKYDSDVLIINILSGINEVVDDICKCDRIASSSLHGIIAADAYGIPSIWIEFSESDSGNGFKFYDYFESVGRKNERPFRITENITVQNIYDEYKSYKLDISLEQLLDACPFLDIAEINSIKKRLNP